MCVCVEGGGGWVGRRGGGGRGVLLCVCLDSSLHSCVTCTQESQGAEGSSAATEGASTSGDLPHYTNILDTIRAFKKREFRPSPRVCAA